MASDSVSFERANLFDLPASLTAGTVHGSSAREGTPSGLHAASGAPLGRDPGHGVPSRVAGDAPRGHQTRTRPAAGQAEGRSERGHRRPPPADRDPPVREAG